MDNQLLLFNLSELFIFDDNDLENEQLLEWIMSMGEPSIFSIHMLKDRGNSCFKDGNISLAVGLYKFALNLFCFIGFSTSHDQHSTSSLALSLVLNLAACELKLSHFNQVCCYCNLVLKFDPRNVKALYRRGLAYSQTNSLTEALKDFEHVLHLDPTNKDANRELVAVVDRLVVNPNGKKVASPFDPLGSCSNKGKKPLILDDVTDKCDGASCSNVPLSNNLVDSHESGARTSSNSAMDLDKVCEDEPMLPADDSCDISDHRCDISDFSSTNSTSFTFTNQKQAQNKLNLSSQGYENLMQGKNVEFFHPRSMSFMRVRPLMSKTIQTGTPLEENPGSAEVPIPSPLDKEQVQYQSVILENDKVVQEQVAFQTAKKKRISLDSAHVNKVSVFQFEFIAVRESESKKRRCKVVSSRHQGGVIRACAGASVHPRRRPPFFVNFSHSQCRYTKKEAVVRYTGKTEIDNVVTGVKRKEADVFHFDAYYHPPYKKCRVNVSVSVSCTIRSVSWLSSSSLDSGIPGFVL